MYSVVVAALGMLSTIEPKLAIDAYSPISDNAEGIFAMAGMSHKILERTDALDAAGNTSVSSGKGFAIGSATLVSLALFGAFFSAMTMKSVGSATLKMVEEVRGKFNVIPGLMEKNAKPDYVICVTICTDASIKEMIPPNSLVTLNPLIVGICFNVAGNITAISPK
ncbi:hypothetical protein KIW84_024844 [Lathyrus oleraceus]|uniref:H(+)-exporting diphosphatase n=1 Tax=Pisum sativum TaxID=3888 RepID=A0A9D4YGK6_PEA|nr:hypothetical protein KIW84_024844 [Pisum sativum]